MDPQQRLQALEDEFQELKEEWRRILLDIRAFLMELHTPLPGEWSAGKGPSQGGSGRRDEHP
ncbi:MAG: hypothetical protein SV910_02275 [Chloroflexota bacterium]|nr:hypothetical protein [Chloroflexota bacterium]